MTRELETIRIERRFGGWLPVLEFVDKTREDASRRVFQSPELALEQAKEYIAQPGYNIKWWVE